MLTKFLTKSCQKTTQKALNSSFKLVRAFSSLDDTLQQIKTQYNIKDTSLNRYLEEKVILVDPEDNQIGEMSLLESHLSDRIEEDNLTHRAFSLLLFDSEYNLLVQRRSLKKIAFPGTWGNSCCSHPLYNLENERVEQESLGVRQAAERRSEQELSLTIKHENIIPAGRIYYREFGEEFFGESEIDHILFSAVLGVKPDFMPQMNENEIMDLEWVSLEGLDSWIESTQAKDQVIAPWFLMMTQVGLKSWWKELKTLGFEEFAQSEKRAAQVNKIIGGD